MKKLVLFVLLAVFVLTGCSPILTGQASAEDEKYAVYAALIRAKFMTEEVQTIVIRDETATDMNFTEEQLQWVLEALPGVDKAMLDSFRVANAQPVKLEDLFGLEKKTVLLPQKEMDQFFAPGSGMGGWDAFYQTYPNAQGITTLSQVGFNEAGDRALVYVGTQSHWLAGGGYYVQLVKKDSAWVIENEIMTWIS